MKLSVDAGALLKWAQYLDQTQRKTKTNVAKSINDLGRSVVRQMALDVAKETGVPIHQVASLFDIREATPRNLSWELDASRAIVERTGSRAKLPSRPWEKGDVGEFLQELVKIVTRGDELVCEKCKEIEEGGPYSLEVAKALIPAHPNCRCHPETFTPTRRMPVTFATRFGAAPRAQKLSVSELAEVFAKTADVAISILAKGI